MAVSPTLIATAAAVATLAVAAGGVSASPTTAGSCDAAVARDAVSSYVHMFNAGSLQNLDQLFAPTPVFRWYAVAPPHGRVAPEAMKRGSLRSFFRGRHRQGEIQKLVRFTFASTQTRAEGLVANFNGVITRRAKDLPFARHGFKATIHCEDGVGARFIVLSIGTNARP